MKSQIKPTDVIESILLKDFLGKTVLKQELLIEYKISLVSALKRSYSQNFIKR